MLVVGNEPNDSPERQPGAIGGKGFEGEAQPAQPPLASPNVRTLGRLAPATQRCHEPAFVSSDLAPDRLVFTALRALLDSCSRSRSMSSSP